MLVDIIIPAYNPGPYLDEAIRSCLGQSYGDYSITVVDDCSSQDLRPIVSNYDCVKYIRNDKNMGPAFSRNIGILNTGGELISFLDADDVWDQNKLLYSVREFKNNKDIGMTCGNYRILSRGRLHPPFYKRAMDIDYKMLFRNNYVASGSVTLKREVVEDVGLFNDEYWIAEDYDMWLRVAEKYPVKYINKVLYYYRVMGKGSSLTQRADIQSSHAKNLRLIKSNSASRMALRGLKVTT